MRWNKYYRTLVTTPQRGYLHNNNESNNCIHIVVLWPQQTLTPFLRTKSWMLEKIYHSFEWWAWKCRNVNFTPLDNRSVGIILSYLQTVNELSFFFFFLDLLPSDKFGTKYWDNYLLGWLLAGIYLASLAPDVKAQCKLLEDHETRNRERACIL